MGEVMSVANGGASLVTKNGLEGTSEQAVLLG